MKLREFVQAASIGVKMTVEDHDWKYNVMTDEVLEREIQRITVEEGCVVKILLSRKGS